MWPQVAASLVIPCLLISRVLGAAPGPLDLLLTALAATLFTVVGALAALHEKGSGNHVLEMGKQFLKTLTGNSISPNKEGAVLALCILTLVTAIILLMDALVMARGVSARRRRAPQAASI